MPTPTPTDKLSPTAFAEMMRRMLWGVRRLRAKLADYLERGPETIPAGQLREAIKVVADSVEAKRQIDAAVSHAARILGEGWEGYIDGQRPAHLAVMAAIQHRIRSSPNGIAEIKTLFDYTATALRAGHDALEAQTEWKLQIAQSELDFWTRMLELSQLPMAAFRAVVAGAAQVAADTAGTFLSALLAALKPLLPYLAVGGVAYFGLRSLGSRGRAGD